MFESLREGLDSAVKSLSGKAKLTEGNMRDALGVVRQSLLEADVSFPVVKDFIANVTEQALGEKVLKSLQPGQQFVGIVHQELINLMGPVDHAIPLKKDGLTILMLCGLQGSGKTTTCAKLARRIKRSSVKPMLAAADLQRPAAIEQLRILGEQIGVPVYTDLQTKDPVKVCQAAVAEAKKNGAQVLILDTAGRLAIDEELMGELRTVEKKVGPDHVYLVVDGMTGQDAVNSAKGFNDALELDGVIMTKLDGDARGGAALSVKAITGVPIKFAGIGEKIEDLDEFDPERMAGRILGQGDMVGLFQKAQEEFDQDELQKQQERLEAGQFTLDDFRKQMSQIKKLGPMQKVLGMLGMDGGMGKMLDNVDPEKDMKRMFGIIDSMTAAERRNPTKVIDQSRRRRIAAGSGVEPHEVNELVKQFDVMHGMMTAMAGKSTRERMQMAKQLQNDAMANPGGQLQKQKGTTGKRLSAKERAKLKKQRDKERRKRLRDAKG